MSTSKRINPDGLQIKIVFTNLGRKYKKVGNILSLMVSEPYTKMVSQKLYTV